MLFSRSFFAAVLFAPLAAYAQSKPNPFSVNGTIQASAGQPLDLKWKPTTQGTVSLILRSGSSNNLAAGTTIVANIPNNGEYVWNVPSSAVRGSDYTVEIVSDSNPSETNYTPPFVLDSANTGPQTMSTVTLGAPTASVSSSSSSSASPTSSSGSSTGTSTTTSAHSTSSMATSTTAKSSSATSASAASSSTSAHTGGAPRATQMAGILGVVALGAFAL